MPYTQEEVEYIPAGGPHKCFTCEFFQPPFKCVKVEGEIYSEGWCKLWTQKTRKERFLPMLRGASLQRATHLQAVQAAMKVAESSAQRISKEIKERLADAKSANGNGEQYEEWLKQVNSGEVTDDSLKAFIRSRAHQNRTTDLEYANGLFKLIGDTDSVASIKTAGGTIEYEKVSSAIFRIRHNGRIISRGRKPLDGDDVKRILRSVLEAAAPSVRFVSSEDEEDEE